MGLSDLREKLEKWIESRFYWDEQETAFALLDLLWPVIEAAQKTMSADNEADEVKAFTTLVHALNKLGRAL